MWAFLSVTRLNSHQRVIVKCAATLLCVFFYETTYIKPAVAAVNKVCCKTVFVKKLVNIKSRNEVNVTVTVMLHEQ